VTEPTDPAVEAREDAETAGWLQFVRSRAGERADRKAARRERRVLYAVLLVVMALVAGLVLWQPWGGSGQADTGDEALGADRVSMLLQVQGDGGAAATAVLLRDRRGKGRGAIVPVPATLGLPVEGTAAATVRSALDDAGPTLTREALGELIGVSLVGSWVLSETEFATLVDRLGGLRIGGATVDGKNAVTRAAGSATGAGEVLGALVAGFPTGFSAASQILADLGVLDTPGLPVPRLAAVLCGLARDSAAERLTVTALPVDGGGARLDPRAAGPVIRDVLGGEPGAGRADETPRIAVSIAEGSGVAVADVRADVLGAGYEYLPGDPVAAGTASSVVVRAGRADAEALGADVADLLGLPASVVRVGDDVPFGADVAVVIGRGRLNQ
jgi:hypothetical protein